jgi:hypothetical protein
MEVKKQNTSAEINQTLTIKCKSCGQVHPVIKSEFPAITKHNWKKPETLEDEIFTAMEVKRNWQNLCLWFINVPSPCCYASVILLCNDRTPKDFIDWYYKVVRPPKLNGFIRAFFEIKKRLNDNVDCFLTVQHFNILNDKNEETTHTYYFVYNRGRKYEDEEEFIKEFILPKDEQPQKAEEVIIVPTWFERNKRILKVASEVIIVGLFFYAIIKFLLIVWA